MMDTMADTRYVNAKITWLCKRDSVGPSELARIAGVTRHAARQYFSDADSPSLPSGPALRAIAEHFEVSMHWLLDVGADEKHPQSDAEILTDEYLIHEAARRYAAAEVRLLCIIEAAESIDWENAAKQVEAGASDELTLSKLAVARELHQTIQNTIDLLDSVRVARRGGYGLEAVFGDGDHDRRESFRKRIELIFERLMPTPRAASAFMSFTQGHVYVASDVEAAFESVEHCLEKAGIKIETSEARRTRLMTERNARMESAIDRGVRARKSRG